MNPEYAQLAVASARGGIHNVVVAEPLIGAISVEDRASLADLDSQIADLAERCRSGALELIVGNALAYHYSGLCDQAYDIVLKCTDPDQFGLQRSPRW